MQGTTALVIGALLVGVLFIIAAVMFAQEARSRSQERPPEYIMEEAVRFVHARLDPDARSSLGIPGVRRILEWQVHFLQQLAKADKQIPIVVGLTEGTIEYISAQLIKHGYPMDHGDVAVVLELQGEYLMSIGAVGGPADELFEPDPE